MSYVTSASHATRVKTLKSLTRNWCITCFERHWSSSGPSKQNQPQRWFLAELISSILEMEGICFSETPFDTQRTTRRYIPEDGTFYNHRCKNLKSYMFLIIIFLNTIFN
jgi:hypothetical protein